ncbi:sodium pump decarboxylase [Sesbania bispinosa]|nr:sodium pump decarboxylase [Sesbania bispinosa]
MAMELNLRVDDDEEEVLLRNLRASLRTYLPVKPDAPRIIRSNVGADTAMPSSLLHFNISPPFGVLTFKYEVWKI